MYVSKVRREGMSVDAMFAVLTGVYGVPAKVLNDAAIAHGYSRSTMRRVLYDITGKRRFDEEQ